MEQIILSQFFTNVKYIRAVLPYIKTSYFDLQEDQTIFKTLKTFMGKYRKLPTFSAVLSMIENNKTLTERLYEGVIDRLEEIQSYTKEDQDEDWLLESTEKFCQNKAFENGLIKSSEIFDQTGNRYKAMEAMAEAVKVSFNESVGIEVFDEQSIRERHKAYNKKENRFKTHLSRLNDITKGGFKEKCLHILLADTHVGKTMSMCSLAAGFISNGYDVLYVTLEMGEKDISNLIEANLIDIKIDEVGSLPEDDFVQKLMSKKNGRLFVKEFPTGNAGTSNIRALLEDLKYKKTFVPKIIIIDYLNLMRSDRYSDANSYVIVKAIAEEVRGLGVEGEHVMVSATQTNRNGAKSSDIDMTDTAESYGLPATADLLIGLMTSDSLREENLIIWKSLKNRLGGIVGRKFPVKTNFEYAKIFDCDQHDEDSIQNSDKDKAQMERDKKRDMLMNNKVNNSKAHAAQIEEDLFE